MKRDFYIFSNGRLHRKENTLFFTNEEGAKKVIPIETVRSLYVFGEVDFNVKFMDFLTKHEVLMHIFNYYGFYSGSYIPRETLLSGEVIVRQVKHFTMPSKQMPLARKLIDAVTANILKNLQYYNTRGRNLQEEISGIRNISANIESTQNTEELMGIEGQIRQVYYNCFHKIISQEIDFEKRVRRPPDNMMNTLISFGNSLLYTSTLGEIYKTQLNPTISFLHSPGYRRFSLALDISEIFKPILVDRIIFRMLNKSMISEKDFEKDLNYCYMKDKARKIFVKEYDEQLSKTIKHRKLNKHISYRHLIRLECYKLIKFLIEKKKYEAFRIWW
ncbi:MAG: type I-B CRISPR-associated endonuclease Cas1 [Candidatus Cloacimonetes bacterium]|nr:type I-B CRISPR-associated endonuclease Cas1 [Candidatus Cloacimonadota bacterium]